MDVTPSKRRKLDHDGARASAEEEHQSQGQPLSRSKRTDNDNEAVYAGGLYKSSMFKLQVDELLNEVRPNYEKRMGSVDDSLRKLKSLIEGIPERAALPISEAAKLLQKAHKVSVPFPDPKPDRNAAYKLSYSKPSNINVVGSYALKTMVKSSGAPLAVDMVITMPSPIFEKKDYLDYRYFHKRAYYLACIAAGLQDTAQGQFTLRFEYLNGNTLHPIIVASLVSDKKSDFEIHIIPAAPSGLFLESRLHPTKNTIRPKDGSDNLAGASPFYNASLRSDCNVEPYLKLLHSSSKQSAGYRDSCILGRLWLQQRGFGSSLAHGGFGHFEWSVLTALLLSGGGAKGHAVLSSGYSSYQMFKAVVQFLSTTNLVAKPLVYQANDFAPLKSDPPMVFDGQRLQNILYKMTPSSYELLRAEAKTSLEMLNDPTFDQFEAAFIIKTDQPLLRYDCIVQLPIPNQGTEQSFCDHLHHTTSFCRQVYAVLKEGLMDRVRLITVTEPALPSWSMKSVKPTTSEGQCMSISLLFDTANVDRLVDHGPSAEEKKKSAKFQKFWGEKAELRRFKDGSILESLVWSPGTAYSILREIVTHLLKLHFGVEVSSGVDFTGEMFEKLLPATAAASRSFEALMEAYRGFEKNIRDLEGLPLQLRQLSSISPQLRYSSIIPPSFSPLQPLREPADVLIQFEGSGRWPDDIAAIQRTKIAFLIKIGSLLEESDDSITTRLGLENKEYPLQNCAFLDVIYGSGAVFRLRIHNDREQTLLEHQIKEKSNDNRAREDSVAALATYKRVYTQLPLHTQSISTHCTRFPLLSPTIRLVKVWFDRHMLSGHVSEELIELLVIHTFLQAFPWTAPSSVMSGFLRTLLFISRWDWRISPVIVDFTGTMTSKEVSSINTRLEAWRKIDPGTNRTVVLAASNHDMTGAAFTDRGPSKMVASRLTALARSACKLVKEKGLDLDHRSLFASSTKDYDFIIHLGSKYVSKNKNQLSQQTRFKNLEIQSDSNLELVGYDPVELYISELERIYGNSIVLFHSMTNRPFIAGLWNPQNTPRSFKVNLLYATKPAVDGAAAEQDFVEMDKQAMLAEISRIGGDIVSKVEVNR